MSPLWGVSVGVALSHKLHVLCNLLWGNNGKSIAVCCVWQMCFGFANQGCTKRVNISPWDCAT